jgi:hypothetical protein
MLLSSAVTVLKATLSIIAHTDNNATLKPARRSPVEAETCLSIWRGAPRSRFLPLDRPRPGGVGARPGESLAPNRSRGQAGGPASRKRGRRPVAVEPAEAVEPGVELAGRAPIARGREAGRAVESPRRLLKPGWNPPPEGSGGLVRGPFCCGYETWTSSGVPRG